VLGFLPMFVLIDKEIKCMSYKKIGEDFDDFGHFDIIVGVSGFIRVISVIKLFKNHQRGLASGLLGYYIFLFFFSHF
jgi:hypothetical protein